MTEAAQEEKFFGHMTQSLELYHQAYQIMVHVRKLLEWQLPPVHHEKVIYSDRIAQLAVAIGNLELAKLHYREAYEYSCLASGIDTKPTLAIKKLMENPPQSLDELLACYSHNSL